MAARNYQSIGDVLVSLKTEFPDITISKLRFLESEGLIAPERTPSGYRKFYEHDVERLRAILRLQRDEYLPLKVIKERLDHSDESSDGETWELLQPIEAEVDAEDLPEPAQGLKMTISEMSQSTGVLPEEIKELETYGILCSHGPADAPYYDGDDHQVLTIAKDFLDHDIGGRHLQKYRRWADREAEDFESKVAPLVRQKNPEARRKATDTLQELSRASRRLSQALLRIRLKQFLDP